MLHLYLEPTVPHISLVVREMWDSTAFSLRLSIRPMDLGSTSVVFHISRNTSEMPGFPVRGPKQHPRVRFR
jgi:hypothetical protein